jgi:signal transduction histidine kinase
MNSEMMTSCSEREDQIIIQIVDNGKGMSPEVLRQALNPFFTTKPVGSGTGIGLSLTERIIKRHGGMIDISSKEGEGTTVTMTLPVGGEVGREQD